MSMKTGERKDNKIAKYYRSTKSEFKKIIWPTPQQTAKNTMVVLLVVALFGTLIAGLDTLFTKTIVQWFVK